MKPVRILCITRAHAENAGGMERLSFELIQELKKLPTAAVTVMKRTGTFRLGAVLFVCTSLPRALALARHADVIHLGDPVLALHGWLIKKIARKPVAVTIHGLDVTYANPLYQLYLRLFGQFDLCFPISRYAEQLLENSKIKTQNSKVITPGIYDRYFDPSITRDQLHRLVLQATGYQVQADQKVLLTVGRLVKRKGHAWFIENVIPKLPATTLYLVAGDGPEKEGLRRIAQKNKNVLLLGRVSESEAKILYNIVDAFVQPNIEVSGDAEGFGLVLLEAALCQRPIFASNLEGIADAIQNRRNGHLLPTQDAPAWIAALSQTLIPSSSSREYTLQNFGWSTQAKKYAKALSSL